MSAALQICLGVLVVIFILAWLYTRMYPTPPPQGCDGLPGNQARYPRETKPEPAERKIWRREARERQRPQRWRSRREPRAQDINRRVTKTRGALKQFETAPSRNWHRTDRIRAQGQGLQQPNIQNGVQTSMLLENQRRAASAASGDRARARRLGDTPAWDRLRNQGVDVSPGLTRAECIEWLNNPNIMQRSEDHVCWQYADRDGTMADQVNRRLERREEYAEQQSEEAAEFMAENPDAGLPTLDDDAPMTDTQQRRRQRRLSNRVDRRLDRRESFATDQATLAAQWRSQHSPEDDYDFLRGDAMDPAEMMGNRDRAPEGNSDA